MNDAKRTLRSRARQQISIWSAAALFFSLVAAYAQPPQSVSAWATTTGDAVARFLPGPAPGLVPRITGDPTNYNEPGVESGYDASATSGPIVGYMPIFIHQNWRYDEPELVQQAAAAQKRGREDAAQQAKNIQEYQKEHAAEIKELQKQAADLARAGKYQEMQETQEKMMALMMPAGSGQNLDAPDPLKRARSVTVLITVNESRLPSTGFVGGNIPGNMMAPSGTAKGHPAYRYAKHDPDYGELSEQRVLAVFLGPAQFHESYPPNSGLIAGKAKCISVRVNVRSRPDTADADEKIARQLLETLDYDGLSGLVQK